MYMNKKFFSILRSMGFVVNIDSRLIVLLYCISYTRVLVCLDRVFWNFFAYLVLSGVS